MYDEKGNLKPGYRSERSVDYILRNLETGNALERRLRTPNEAADLNELLKHTNQRWVPLTLDLASVEALTKFHENN